MRNGLADCATGSDETAALTCADATEFRCTASGACLPRYRVNDGFRDCNDSSDEDIWAFQCHAETEFQCKAPGATTRCIPRLWVRNGIRDCLSGNDEFAVLASCSAGEFRCLDEMRCLPSEYLCDGVANCDDGSDEIELCDGAEWLSRCYSGDGSLANVQWHNLYRADAGFNSMYDGDMACEVGVADEVFLYGLKCFVDYEKMFQSTSMKSGVSATPKTVPPYLIRMGISVCVSGTDRCYDDAGAFNCERCLDNRTVIAASQICDGVIDCADLSDECACARSQVEPLCSLLYPTGGGGDGEAREEAPARLNVSSVCKRSAGGVRGSLPERFCSYESLPTYNATEEANLAARPDGGGSAPSTTTTTIDCMSDLLYYGHFADFVPQMYEQDAVENQYQSIATMLNRCFTFLSCIRIMYMMPSPIWCEVDQTRLTSEQLEHVDMYETDRLQLKANGTVREVALTNVISELCDLDRDLCLWRYYCRSASPSASLFSIDINRLCDFARDCPLGDDERNCSSSHFYCWNDTDAYVPRSHAGDGIADCPDGSDECVNDNFSDPFEMIRNGWLRGFVWVSALVTLAANALVSWQHLRTIRDTSDKKSVPFLNAVLLLNLSGSDALMGCALLSIAVKSTLFSGVFCHHNYAWRTSTTCHLTGMLTMVSSQTSMNMLVLLTSLRLYHTTHPFALCHINLKFAYVAVALAWLLPALVAFLPVHEIARFSHTYIIEPNQRFPGEYVTHTAVLKSRARTEMILASNGDAATATGSGGDEIVSIKSYFGYYGSNSICFPEFFSNVSPTFQYSLCVITYNLAALCYILGSYLVILCYTMRSRGVLRVSLRGSSGKNGTDKRIERLKTRVIFIIATNALCWVPIIVMAFVSYGGFRLPAFVYPLSAIVLLPVNSALNPIIYSRLDEYLRFVFRAIKTVLDLSDGSSADEIHS